MVATANTGTVLDGVRGRVFFDRYSLKDEQGETLEQYPEQMWRRVARAIARVEADYASADESAKEKVEHWEEQFNSILTDFKFVPGGRINSGAGTENEVTFFNCFVIPSPHDSRGGILRNIESMTEIMARGGGVGVNLSSLRPRGSYIKSVNGRSSGPVNWGEIYSVMTGKVIQQGGSRRGALMIMLDDDHPDIMEFITAKKIDPLTNKPVALEYANVSVAVSDRFMEAVKNDEEWQTQFPTYNQVPLIARENGWSTVPVEYGKKYRAREIWDAICESAWRTAEPGVVFMERANKLSNTWYYEKIMCVNPCGEQPLGAWQVCNLGAMNLSAYVVDSVAGEPDSSYFDYPSLERDVQIAVRFLDNVIDASPYFIDENREAQMGTRRTGLGTMGLADTLIKLGIRYGSDAESFIDMVYSTIRDAAYIASCHIAAEKGAFPEFKSQYLEGAFIKGLPLEIQSAIGESGIRNAVILTQAPTGSTSLLSGVSSGIEPVFSFAMKRVDRTGESIMYHPLLQEWLEQHPGQERPAYFVDANDLSPEDHIAVQARIQAYTDSSISKTVNGPNDHTVEDVKRLYMLAYDSGCKGVTYYRDGSRDAVLTRIEPEKPAEVEKVTFEAPGAIRQRPALLRGYTRSITAPEGKVNITVNEDGDGPFEVFVNVGRAGSDVAALAEGVGRLISLVLRIPSSMTPQGRLDEVASQLRGIGGSRFAGFGPNQVRSLVDGVSKVLTQHRASSSEAKQEVIEEFVDEHVQSVNIGSGASTLTGNLCPECHEFTLVMQEGCKKCFSCGHSEC